LQDLPQERLVLPAEAEGYSLAERAESVTPDVVALQQREGPSAGAVLAHDLDRPGGGVHLPDRLHQGVQRDRVPGVVLGQLQKLQGEFVAEPVHPADELQSLLVGQAPPLDAVWYALRSVWYCSAGVAGLSWPWSPAAADRPSTRTRIPPTSGDMEASPRH